MGETAREKGEALVRTLGKAEALGMATGTSLDLSGRVSVLEERFLRGDTEPITGVWGCGCEGWERHFQTLNMMIVSAERHGWRYHGGNFRYCPWCAKELEPKAKKHESVSEAGMEIEFNYAQEKKERHKTQIVKCMGCGELVEVANPYFGSVVCDKCGY